MISQSQSSLEASTPPFIISNYFLARISKKTPANYPAAAEAPTELGRKDFDGRQSLVLATTVDEPLP